MVIASWIDNCELTSSTVWPCPVEVRKSAAISYPAIPMSGGRWSLEHKSWKSELCISLNAVCVCKERARKLEQSKTGQINNYAYFVFSLPFICFFVLLPQHSHDTIIVGLQTVLLRQPGTRYSDRH